MTRLQALLLRLFDFYQVFDYELSQLEAQKLAYFLQVAGEPLRLRYAKGKYGPTQTTCTTSSNLSTGTS